MKTETLLRFDTLCLEAKQACEQMNSSTQYEPYLQRVLAYVKAHPSLRAEFSDAFVQMLANSSKGPWELIAFCMHDLRWSEVQTAAIDEQQRDSDHRVKTIMANVIDAFSDNWGDADLYNYYSKTTNE